MVIKIFSVKSKIDYQSNRQQLGSTILSYNECWELKNKVKMKIKPQKNVCQNLDQNMSKRRKKNGRFSPFSVIGVSVETTEYSVPNIRLVLAEYSAEYSVFGRTLIRTQTNSLNQIPESKRRACIFPHANPINLKFTSFKTSRPRPIDISCILKGYLR